MKNEHAAALGRMKKGKKEKPSQKKKDSSRSNLDKARESRWIEKLTRAELPNEHEKEGSD